MKVAHFPVLLEQCVDQTAPELLLVNLSGKQCTGEAYTQASTRVSWDLPAKAADGQGSSRLIGHPKRNGYLKLELISYTGPYSLIASHLSEWWSTKVNRAP